MRKHAKILTLVALVLGLTLIVVGVANAAGKAADKTHVSATVPEPTTTVTSPPAQTAAGSSGLAKVPPGQAKDKKVPPAAAKGKVPPGRSK